MSRVTRLTALWMIAVAGLSAGCSVDYQLTAQGLKAAVEVNLVGVTRGEVNQWLNYSMTNYWNPGDTFRTQAETSGIAYRMNFGGNQAAVQVLKGDDPIHQKWAARKVEYVLVLAHLPGYGSKDDKPGDQDPRRLVLWLDPAKYPKSAWGNHLVDIEVTAAKITLLRDMDPLNLPAR